MTVEPLTMAEIWKRQAEETKRALRAAERLGINLDDYKVILWGSGPRFFPKIDGPKEKKSA